MAETEGGASEMAQGSSTSNIIYHSIPRGGPLYLSNLVGSLTKPPFFQSHLLSELKDLREELGQDFSDIGEDDLSVDELKIVTEEELVDKAFDIAFKDDEVPKKFPEVSEECLEESRTDSGKLLESRNNVISESSNKEIDGASLDDTSCGPSGKSDVEEGSSNIAKKKKGKKQKSQNNAKNRRRKRKRDDSPINDKKRKRKRQTKEAVEETYIAKVKQLVRVKEKQLEDKAAAKLHSFNGGCRINDSAPIVSDKTERTTSLRSNNSIAKARISSSHEGQVLQPGKEVVLCVEVYHNKRTLQKTQEFLVLGRQFLTELRDKIYCLTDQLMERAGQHDTSGYFLVEDAFCNDLRDVSAIDYSKPILDWLKDSKKEALEKWEYIISGRLQPKQKALVDNKKKENLPRFKAASMQNMRFCDLNFRLGAGYLYCHQGDCKHTIIIRDMRLIHPEDVQDRFAYPVVTFQIKPRIRKCSVCQIFRAKLVTVDDKWAGENPSYFCDACYYMLHYADGSLLYPDFSVYDYHHDQI
ncbi:snRNA-activating protein complex subunit [Heracleum sosnowskyi]|uniref:snRNA-activating protein complex subunit n=1 Tax=Heracleum sosnowskyi TaxID=360622 RepID=A0AAD8HEB8_9APIA|nr:snRNA-activating protein complex subunit [Heracleum sosnowskyi]